MKPQQVNFAGLSQKDVVAISRFTRKSRGACGKKKYSKGAANKKLTNLVMIGRQESRVYFCQQCNAYHLTKKING